ncbi:MAG TPA: DUF5655 domain-containing protein [Flavobacteriales bacterium]|nr:DUF5655 domain-containing protein [Flavobacteriales bacterium]
MTQKTENDIAKFFRGKNGSLKLFKLLRKLIEEHRSPKIEVSKTQISFGEDYKYIWVWLPQTWIKKRSESSITLTIVTGKKIQSDKIEESVQPKKGYWTHHIIIENSSDIDKEIEQLIQESIHFYLARLAHKRKQKTKKKTGK